MIRIQLTEGDVPGVEAKGTLGHGVDLHILDDNLKDLVVAKLNKQERQELIQALQLIELDESLVG